MSTWHAIALHHHACFVFFATLYIVLFANTSMLKKPAREFAMSLAATRPFLEGLFLDRRLSNTFQIEGLLVAGKSQTIPNVLAGIQEHANKRRKTQARSQLASNDYIVALLVRRAYYFIFGCAVYSSITSRS